MAELDDVAARAAAAVARDERIDAAIVTFLLRHYLATDAADLRDALGLALAQALALAEHEDTVIHRAAWLMLLIEATAVSDDERIRPAVAQLASTLQALWPAPMPIDDLAASVEACLRAAEIIGPGAVVQDAIDQLERVIGGAYRPGDGLARDRGGVRIRCGLADHVRCASALLTAFELTGRLPYSMLAEELILVAGRGLTPNRPPEGGHDSFDAEEFVVQCEAAGVLCRLARLHDDPDYRGAAVVSTGADYRAQASRILAAQSAHARTGTTSAAAAYGLALRDLLQDVR
ncbi:MAG: hypothetical protein ACRD2I_03305 [Vicinamibacterales bacterium]